MSYNPITGEEIEQHLPPVHNFEFSGGGDYEGGEDEDSESISSSTDDEEVAIDYHECKELYDDLFPFENCENDEMSAKDKLDMDVVTPFLFGRLVGGLLTVDQAKRLGDLKSRRKLYRELTSLFQGD